MPPKVSITPTSYHQLTISLHLAIGSRHDRFRYELLVYRKTNIDIHFWEICKNEYWFSILTPFIPPHLLFSFFNQFCNTYDLFIRSVTHFIKIFYSFNWFCDIHSFIIFEIVSSTSLKFLFFQLILCCGQFYFQDWLTIPLKFLFSQLVL